mgnify:CR=1 FL=1
MKKKIPEVSIIDYSGKEKGILNVGNETIKVSIDLATPEKAKAGDCCRSGVPGCYCKTGGRPYEEMCPDCRDKRTCGDTGSRCSCTLTEDEYRKKTASIRISLNDDFSHTPGGRLRDEGEHSAQQFREDYLVPAMEAEGGIYVELGGTAGCAGSFLHEAFGPLGKAYGAKEVFNRMLIADSDGRDSNYHVEAMEAIVEDSNQTNRIKAATGGLFLKPFVIGMLAEDENDCIRYVEVDAAELAIQHHKRLIETLKGKTCLTSEELSYSAISILDELEKEAKE